MKRFISVALLVVFSFGYVAPAFAGGGGDDCPAPKKAVRKAAKKSCCVTVINKMNGVDQEARDAIAALDKKVDGKADKSELAKTNDRVTKVEEKTDRIDRDFTSAYNFGWYLFWILVILGAMALVAGFFYWLANRNRPANGHAYAYPPAPIAPPHYPAPYYPAAPAPQPAPQPAPAQGVNPNDLVRWNIQPITLNLTPVPQGYVVAPPAAQ